MRGSRFFLKIIFALGLGVYATLLYVQHDQGFINFVHAQLKEQLHKRLHITFQGTVKSLDLLRAQIVIENVVCVPVDTTEHWSFRAESCLVNFSWFLLWYTKKFYININCKKLHAKSGITNNSLTLIESLKKIIYSSQESLPIILHSITLQQAQTKIDDPLFAGTWVTCNGQCNAVADLFKIRFYVTDGSVVVGHRLLLSKMLGSFQGTIQVNQKTEFQINTDLTMKLEGLEQSKQDIRCEGIWTEQQAICKAYNQDRSFEVNPLTLTWHDQVLCQAQIVIPATYFATFFGLEQLSKDLRGSCVIDFVTSSIDKISGQLVSQDLGYAGHAFEKVKLSFVKDTALVRGLLEVHKNEGFFSGPWSFDLPTQQFEINLTNHTNWPLGFNTAWQIPAYKGSFVGKYDHKAQLASFDSAITVHNSKTDVSIPFTTKGSYNASGLLVADGMIDVYTYSSQLQLIPFLKPLFISCSNAANTQLLSWKLQSPEHEIIEADISYELIQKLLQHYFEYNVSGQGSFHITGTCKDALFKTHLETHNSTIELPETYNFISVITGNCTFDSSQRTILFEDFLIKLHKGFVGFSKARIDYDDAYNLTFMHIPITFKKCFLNWKDIFLAVTSGSCLLQKKGTEPYVIEALLVLERGQLKENPFSVTGQQAVTQSFLPTTLFDPEKVKITCTVMTEKPLHIKTPQIESRAVIDLTLENFQSIFQFSGKLRLLGGQIYFPYKPLYITRAEVKFLPTQTVDDPFVQLLAQGTLKRYGVTLLVSGTLQDPHITVSSVPALSEEQIISLLFTGSLDESLNVLVPTLVMRNIESFIFGPAHNRIADTWLSPLKNIRFIPSFIDQTGRGGFRGAIEIDVNEQLHAKLQKNFSLSEDTRIEFEYLASDEISFKAIKDERSDLGAEVEMRFKF